MKIVYTICGWRVGGSGEEQEKRQIFPTFYLANFYSADILCQVLGTPGEQNRFPAELRDKEIITPDRSG